MSKSDREEITDLTWLINPKRSATSAWIKRPVDVLFCFIWGKHMGYFHIIDIDQVFENIIRIEIMCGVQSTILWNMFVTTNRK